MVEDGACDRAVTPVTSCSRAQGAYILTIREEAEADALAHLAEAKLFKTLKPDAIGLHYWVSYADRTPLGAAVNDLAQRLQSGWGQVRPWRRSCTERTVQR